ncbi:unnamed protein product [Schistosoma margrebowiei]|uniref:DUF6451 domain-containing protein n=1 Tax=Schistosoma margrebowiei TaxID=48269 RepID=A0A3P8AFU8_9TREM|nr:unnamed protein product [Schistosoma margrebowiei]
MGSIIDGHGISYADVKAQIGKARAAFLQLKNIWNSKQLSTNTKVRIFNIHVFTYLGRIIDEQGGLDANVKALISKAKAAFLQLKNIWNSKQLSINIKIRIFNTTVKIVLLYGGESWRTTTTIIKKV